MAGWALPRAPASSTVIMGNHIAVSEVSANAIACPSNNRGVALVFRYCLTLGSVVTTFLFGVLPQSTQPAVFCVKKERVVSWVLWSRSPGAS